MRRHGLFLGLLVLVAASRFVVLFASQTHVHSDEAIIGLMAKHISEGRFYPFYMYGQPYNAGTPVKRTWRRSRSRSSAPAYCRSSAVFSCCRSYV